MMLLTSYIIKQILLSINQLVHNHNLCNELKFKNVFIYVIASNKVISTFIESKILIV